jgi:hypothetical protein
VRPPLRGAPFVLAALAIALCHASSWAASTVYRCGQTYQQAPCAEGKAVDVDDARSAEQLRDRHAATATDKRLAKELEADRQARDKAIHPQTKVAGIAAPSSALPASTPSSGNPACKRQGKSKGHTLRCVGDTPLYLAKPNAPVGR